MVREAGSSAGHYSSTAARRAARRIAGEACEKALHRCKQEVAELKQDVEAYRKAFAAILEGGIIQKPVVDRLAAVAPALAALCKGNRPSLDAVLRRNVSLHAEELPAMGAPLSAWRRAQRGQRLGTRRGDEQGDQGEDEGKWWAAQHATRIQAATIAANRNTQHLEQPTIETHVPEVTDVEKENEQIKVCGGTVPPEPQSTEKTGDTEDDDIEEATNNAKVYDTLNVVVHTAEFPEAMAQLLQNIDVTLALGDVPNENCAETEEWKPTTEVTLGLNEEDHKRAMRQRLQQMMEQDAKPNLTKYAALASGKWHAGDQTGPSVQPVPHWQDALPPKEQGATWACRQKAWENISVEESTDEEDATQKRRRQKFQQLRDQEYRKKHETKERLRLRMAEETPKPTDALAAAAAQASVGILASAPEPAADCKQS